MRPTPSVIGFKSELIQPLETDYQKPVSPMEGSGHSLSPQFGEDGIATRREGGQCVGFPRRVLFWTHGHLGTFSNGWSEPPARSELEITIADQAVVFDDSWSLLRDAGVEVPRNFFLSHIKCDLV